jgi:molybdopterin-guanine dinucleotide biosynthesis protein A
MGTDKATLLIGGEPLAERVARVLTQVCEPVVEVGPGVSGLEHIDDLGAGPLAAFVMGVDRLAVEGSVVLLACDLPRFDFALMRALADAPGDGSVVPILDGRAQYACARWSVAAIAAGRAALAAGRFRLAELASVGFDALTDPELTAEAIDVDTPDDLRRLGLP